QQRGLAGAGWPHQREEITARDVQVDVVQHLEFLLAAFVHLGEIAGLHQRLAAALYLCDGCVHLGLLRLTFSRSHGNEITDCCSKRSSPSRHPSTPPAAPSPPARPRSGRTSPASCRRNPRRASPASALRDRHPPRTPHRVRRVARSRPSAPARRRSVAHCPSAFPGTTPAPPSRG